VNVGTEIVSEKKGTPGTEIEFQVLAGAIPGQEGTTLSEAFWHSPKALDRLLAFAMACGALRPGQNRDLTGPDYNGLQLVIEVQPRKYTDSDGNEKETVEVSYNGFWEINHPEVKDVPKDQAAIQQIGQLAQQPAAVGGPPVQQVQGVPQQLLDEQSPQPTPVATPPQQTAPAPPTGVADWSRIQP
jgi:hypothetical protein